MRETGDNASGRPVRRLSKAGLVVSWLILVAPAAYCLAETVPDDVPRTQGADGAGATDAKPPHGAVDNTAAIRAEISRTIASFEADVREAYHRELINNPKIDGEITVSFTVRPDGDVSEVAVKKSSLNWPPLEEEILNRIKSWKFSPFEGKPIPATVPYQFKPK